MLYLTVLEGPDPLRAEPLFSTDDKRIVDAVVREINKRLPAPITRRPRPTAAERQTDEGKR